MDKNSKIYVAGHKGMVGSAITRKLKELGYTNIIFSSIDLRIQNSVKNFFKYEKPEYVFLAAAKVGGMYANEMFPANFIYDNLCIQTNIIDSAYTNKCEKLLFLGSSCVYPKNAIQPINEDKILTSELEPTNENYAIAKIAGIKMCQAYKKQYNFNSISLMPANVYGENDNFDFETSHFLPALIRKFHYAKTNNKNDVIIFGTGKPKRELIHVDDLADACVFLMNYYDSDNIINVGTGKDSSIIDIAYIVKDIVGFTGNIQFDNTRADGTMRKVLDISKLSSLGWHYNIDLCEGIKRTYEWYINNNIN